MMLNMIEPGRDRSARTQRRLQNLARTWSGSRPDGRQRQGASVRGWAAGLNILGAGPYKLVGDDTIQGALRTAAKAIAETGKPVGLLVWRGRHAWVMSGFTATADPLETDDFRVTAAIVHGPAVPARLDASGGRARDRARPCRRPRSAASSCRAGMGTVSRRPGSVPSRLGGKYVLVLPYEPDLTPASHAPPLTLADRRCDRGPAGARPPARRSTASGVVGSSATMRWSRPERLVRAQAGSDLRSRAGHRLLRASVPRAASPRSGPGSGRSRPTVMVERGRVPPDRRAGRGEVRPDVGQAVVRLPEPGQVPGIGVARRQLQHPRSLGGDEDGQVRAGRRDEDGIRGA